MKLELVSCEYYSVKRGQTLCSVARAFGMPPRVLAEENGLKDEVVAGQILRIPAVQGNFYRIAGGESMTFLCGSKENFVRRNGTDCIYPLQEVLL